MTSSNTYLTVFFIYLAAIGQPYVPATQSALTRDAPTQLPLPRSAPRYLPFLYQSPSIIVNELPRRSIRSRRHLFRLGALINWVLQWFFAGPHRLEISCSGTYLHGGNAKLGNMPLATLGSGRGPPERPRASPQRNLLRPWRIYAKVML